MTMPRDPELGSQKGPMSVAIEATTPLTARAQFEELVACFNEIKQDGFQLASDGEYAEVLQSIEDHKYLTNEKIPFEISMDQALFSWYENVYHPVMQAIDQTGLVYAFPEATRGELFMWVTRHWHFLKMERGADLGVLEAAYSFGDQFGSGLLARLVNRVKALAA